ncbi:hypothetical protein [Streptomyces collinus]|uniref:hypothetical protein n=1 Tax=Streptomyces collinus TaxID=42684 RepID=UPI0036261771
MLALRLTRAARPAVQLRRLLVAAASGGTGFLLLGTLGYALGHPETPGTALPRLAWCVVPLAATVHFALAVARTDPGTRPRPGLSAVGLGPARLMAVSALTTALSTTLGSLLALAAFLHLRGDLRGLPFDGAAAGFLAAGRPLPFPGALTLLALVPALACATVALALRPRDPRPARRDARPLGRFGAYGHTAGRETFGAYGRFGARLRAPARRAESDRDTGDAADGPSGTDSADAAEGADGADGARTDGATVGGASVGSALAGGALAGGALVGGAAASSASAGGASMGGTSAAAAAGSGAAEAAEAHPDGAGVLAPPPAPRAAPAGLPWGVATVAAGLTVQAYAGRTVPALVHLPADAVAVLAGWVLTAFGLVLAGPGLAHLCGRLLQSARPGALRLLAGRGLMAEATRIGRPLGVLCAVVSAAYALTALSHGPATAFGPLTTLGALVVTGCTVATLLTAAVEARQCRAETTAALLRLGAPATMLRGAALLRAAALLVLFGPLTVAVADLAALPSAR